MASGELLAALAAARSSSASPRPTAKSADLRPGAMSGDVGPRWSTSSGGAVQLAGVRPGRGPRAWRPARRHSQARRRPFSWSNSATSSARSPPSFPAFDPGRGPRAPRDRRRGRARRRSTSPPRPSSPAFDQDEDLELRAIATAAELVGVVCSWSSASSATSATRFAAAPCSLGARPPPRPSSAVVLPVEREFGGRPRTPGSRRPSRRGPRARRSARR